MEILTFFYEPFGDFFFGYIEKKNGENRSDCVVFHENRRATRGPTQKHSQLQLEITDSPPEQIESVEQYRAFRLSMLNDDDLLHNM